tara:strand:- start:311 stop:544 length:234 start_codon:yes stop_codon:yes gene_type:complete
MSDETVIIMPDGGEWRPSTSRDVVHCATCDNEVDTPEEIASFPDGNCPECGSSWTGSENRSTMIQVTMPEGITGGAG